MMRLSVVWDDRAIIVNSKGETLLVPANGFVDIGREFSVSVLYLSRAHFLSHDTRPKEWVSRTEYSWVVRRRMETFRAPRRLPTPERHRAVAPLGSHRSETPRRTARPSARRSNGSPLRIRTIDTPVAIVSSMITQARFLTSPTIWVT